MSQITDPKESVTTIADDTYDSISCGRLDEHTNLHGNFTQNQIETLQNQIRLLKTLGKRYAESSISKYENCLLRPLSTTTSSQFSTGSTQDADTLTISSPQSSNVMPNASSEILMIFCGTTVDNCGKDEEFLAQYDDVDTPKAKQNNTAVKRNIQEAVASPRRCGRERKVGSIQLV